MRNALICAVLLLAAGTARADEQVIKECSVSMKQLEGGGVVDMTIQVVASGDALKAKLYRTAGGQSSELFKGMFSAGIELDKVRSAKLYIIGKRTSMGSATIVEARDADGQVMGSFLGGFLIAPCK